MIAFPANTLVTLPARINVQGDSQVAISVAHEDDFIRAKEKYASRINHLIIEAKSVKDENLMRAISRNRVKVVLNDLNVLESNFEIESLRMVKPIFVVPTNGNMLRSINFLSGLNFPVHIEASELVHEKDALLQAADFYLHNPLLTVPIEPFHSILGSLIWGRTGILWDTEYERPGRNFFISDKSEISLSRRWNSSGLNFGRLEDPWDAIIESELYKKLLRLKEYIFEERPACVLCAHLRLCAGFFKAIDPNWPCDAWKMVYDMFLATAQKAKSLLKKMDIPTREDDLDTPAGLDNKAEKKVGK